MSYALGVDIGTTFSAAAVHRQGRAEMVALGYRSALVPSAVLITKDGDTLVGDAALRRGRSEPERLARFFKRRLGDSVPLIVGGSPLSAETLTARLLRVVVDRVAEQQGGRPDAIAVTRPANWGPFKQDRFDQAIRLADLTGVTVITEPEAAALAYAAEERIEPGAVVAVYDLGGGTFDATVLRRTGDRFAVIGEPEGIERLGGIDFDAAVFEHVRRSLDGAIEALPEDDNVTLRAVSRLRDECIDAKEALSSDTQVSIPVVLPGLSTEVRLTRSELETMIRPVLDDSIAALRRAVASADVAPADVDRVLLVGGSSRVPLVAQLVSSAFGRPVALDAHPKHAVALGAALVAGGQGVEARAIGATDLHPIVATPADLAAGATASPGTATATPPSGSPATTGGAAAAGLGAAAVAGGTAAGLADAAPATAPDEGDQAVAFGQGPGQGAAAVRSPADGSLPTAPATPPSGQPTNGDTAPTGETALSSTPATEQAPTPPGPSTDDTWVTPSDPATPPQPSGPPSGDTWVTPPAPTGPTGTPSGDQWAPGPHQGTTPTGPDSGDTWVTPPAPTGPTGTPSGDRWAPAEPPTRSPSDDAWAARERERDDRAPRHGAGAAVGAAAVGASLASGGRAEAAPSHMASSSSGTPSGASAFPGGERPRRRLAPALVGIAAAAALVAGAVALLSGDDENPNAGRQDASTTTTTDGSAATTAPPPTAVEAPALPTNLAASTVLPVAGANPEGITFDDSDRLWVAVQESDGAVQRFDAPYDDPAAAQTLPLPGDRPVSLLDAHDTMWVALRSSERVVRVDKESMEVLDGDGFVTGPEPMSLIAGDDAVFGFANGAAGDGSDAQLFRLPIDGYEGAPSATTAVVQPRGIVFAGDSLWVTEQGNLLQQYDLDLEPMGDPIPVGERADAVTLDDEGRIWVANRGEGTVSLVDPQEGSELGRYDVGGSPSDVEVDGNRVWVVDTDEDGEGDEGGTGVTGRVLVLNAATGAPTARVSAGVRPLDLALDGDSVWVSRINNNDVARIAVAS